MSKRSIRQLAGAIMHSAALASAGSWAQRSAASAPVGPASAPGSAVALSPEVLHQGLRDLNTKMQKALNEMDIDTLLANVTEDVVFTTMNGDRVRGRDGIRKYFEKMMKGPDRVVSSIESHFEADDLSHLYGNDLAVAFGTSKDRYHMAGGDTFEVRPLWTGTMVRRDGKWLIANFHYSTNMFDNPVLDAQRKLLVLGGGGVAAVLAVVAFLLGLALGKKRAK